MSNPLKQIADRRKEIDRLMNDHRNELVRLETEEAELEVAQRVLQRLGAGEEGKTAGDSDPYEDAVQPSSYAGKPPGTPTVPEMIFEILSDRKKAGVERGMEPKGLAEIIAKRWWPEVTATEIGPIAWRMAKREQLKKDGPLYSLPPILDLVSSLYSNAPGNPEHH
jgi:hypothetical protein